MNYPSGLRPDRRRWEGYAQTAVVGSVSSIGSTVYIELAGGSGRLSVLPDSSVPSLHFLYEAGACGKTDGLNEHQHSKNSPKKIPKQLQKT